VEVHQPQTLEFPKRNFGKKVVINRNFQLSWFEKWPWLHYTENDDVKFNQTAKTYHVNECLAILAESGSETTSEVLKIINFPGGMPPDPPSRYVLCMLILY